MEVARLNFFFSGFPSFYEPVTMIDYAHGAHTLPEGEEDRFPPGENRGVFSKSLLNFIFFRLFDTLRSTSCFL